MKIGYFYPSSPEIEYPEVKGLPPSPGITVIESKEIPKEAAVALNFSILDLNDDEPFAVHIALYLNGEKQPSSNGEYTPFRAKSFISKSGKISERYSVIEPFKIKQEGVYTLKMFLFDHHLSSDGVDTNLAIDSTECSILIAEEWK